jgi:hypothetical protein
VLEDLVEDLSWGVTLEAKNGVNVGVVAGATESKPLGELFVVDLAASVWVNVVEKCEYFVLGEYATDSLKSATELLNLNSAETVEVEVLEDTLGSSALIFSTVGALTNFLEENVFELSDAARVDVLDVLGQTPGFDHDIAEVSLTFSREHHGDASVELDEGFFGDHAILRGECTHALSEFFVHVFGFLLARDNAGVGWGVEALDEVIKGATWSALGKEVPGTLNDGEAGVAHISLRNCQLHNSKDNGGLPSWFA